MSALMTKLTVNAWHPAIRIEVLDAGYGVRASGYGRIEEDLPTGLYTVRYAAADAVEDRNITLRPGEPMTLDAPPELRFASAAPLELTSTSHEYHQHHARQLSHAAPLDRGHGAQLFVFIRDLDVGGSGHLAQGLSLHRLDGEMLLHFGEIVEVSTASSEACWAGRNIAVDPGTYRLRLAFGRNEAVETVIVVCPGWQSQVFLLHRGGELGTADAPTLDFASATQFMVPQTMGFEPWSRVRQSYGEPWEAGEDLRLAELARKALAYGWRGVRTDDLQAMLNGKWQDPLLGIFGLHLLLARPQPDLEFAEAVLGRLGAMILREFPHPDLIALTLELARRRGTTLHMPPLEAPPMLRRSWQMLVRASAEQPSLIPQHSLAGRIADRLWGASAWLIWEVPPVAPAQPQAKDWLRDFIEAQGRATERPGIEDLSDRVIIGGVTLFKRGFRRLEEERREGKKEVAQPGDETEDQVPSLVPKEPGVPPSDHDAREGPFGRLDLGSAVRSLIKNPEATLERLPDLDFTAVRSSIESLLPTLQGLIERLGLEGLTQEAALDTAEFALLTQLAELLQLRHRSATAPARDPLSLAALVQRLGMPAQAVQGKLVGLLLKIHALLDRSDKLETSAHAPAPPA
jgi:hypothetical protein